MWWWLILEYFDTRCLYAHNHVQDKKLYVNEYYSRIYQHYIVNNNHILISMVTNSYFLSFYF